MSDLVTLVRGNLGRLERMILGALIVIEVLERPVHRTTRRSLDTLSPQPHAAHPVGMSAGAQGHQPYSLFVQLKH